MHRFRVVLTIAALTVAGASLCACSGDAEISATPDTYFAALDGSLSVAAPGVLENDSDGGRSLQAVLVTRPAHGAVRLNTDGAFTYVGEKNYHGTDSFTYRAVRKADAERLATFRASMSAQSAKATDTTAVSIRDNAITARVVQTISARTNAGARYTAIYEVRNSYPARFPAVPVELSATPALGITVDGTQCDRLASGDTCRIAVHFVPPSAGAFEVRVEVHVGSVYRLRLPDLLTTAE